MRPALVVGQGVCGTVISSLLFQKNIPFKVIDPGESNASKNAAGIINPLVFKRLTYSWGAQSFIPSALQYYKEMELLMNKKLLHWDGLIKLVNTEDEVSMWDKKQKQGQLPDVQSTYENPFSNTTICHSIITKRIKNAGWVDAQLFLQCWREFLHSKDLLIYEPLLYDSLKKQPNEEWKYKGRDYSAIYFCEGWAATKNPWFNALPWIPTWGDLLLIKPKTNLSSTEIIYKNGFLCPTPKSGTFLAGSSYIWNLSPEETKKGVEQVKEKIKNIIGPNFETLEHRFGIRPAVTDRRPIIGLHPEHKNMYIFNGMGTRGFLLAPALGMLLINKTPTPEETSIKRFSSLLSKS